MASSVLLLLLLVAMCASQPLPRFSQWDAALSPSAFQALLGELDVPPALHATVSRPHTQPLARHVVLRAADVPPPEVYRSYLFSTRGSIIALVCGALAVLAGLVIMGKPQHDSTKGKAASSGLAWPWLVGGSAISVTGLAVFGFALSLVEQTVPGAVAGDMLTWDGRISGACKSIHTYRSDSHFESI